ncbi:MAG: BrnT family toxin [Gemmatimonadales bacterium]
MAELRFEWDPTKDQANRRKHKVSFQEAESVFADEHARLLDDPEHSEDEERFILLGLSSRFRVLVVVHTHRGDEDVIRIISARRASKAERTYYDARWQR